MAGVNKVILIGNLGADPELRYTQGGSSVCELRLATNESWLDKQGQRQERTEWHRITAWGKRAEVVAKYLRKGRQIYVEGRLTTETWTDKDNVKRYTTKIVANDIQFLGSVPKEAERPGQKDGSLFTDEELSERLGPPVSATGGPDDDIPF